MPQIPARRPPEPPQARYFRTILGRSTSRAFPQYREQLHKTTGPAREPGRAGGKTMFRPDQGVRDRPTYS